MEKGKILVVEDDRAIRTGLTDLLVSEGFQVFSAEDGREALKLYREQSPDLILLDIMLPEKSGYEVCREIRQQDALVPILMLTAKGEEVDKVAGLELGADDYIVKPFGVSELLARIRAALRRRQAELDTDQEPFGFGGVTIEPAKMSGQRAGNNFSLSQREIQLLQMFYANPGKVLDRNTLLNRLWGVGYQGTTRTLDQHIAQLRKKIEENPSDPKYLHTVHGVGYRLHLEMD